jgi:hypothetical protein
MTKHICIFCPLLKMSQLKNFRMLVGQAAQISNIFTYNIDTQKLAFFNAD